MHVQPEGLSHNPVQFLIVVMQTETYVGDMDRVTRVKSRAFSCYSVLHLDDNVKLQLAI